MFEKCGNACLKIYKIFFCKLVLFNKTAILFDVKVCLTFFDKVLGVRHPREQTDTHCSA